MFGGPSKMKRRFSHRFRDAFFGIGHAFSKERNLKIHTLAAILVVILGLWLRINLEDWAILIGVIGGVIGLELVNTAIERTVDLVTREHHPLARAAKDVAAGAVLFFQLLP